MAKVALGQARRARKIPGTYTGKPGTGARVCGPSRASTRAESPTGDEFPTTITMVGLGGTPREPSAEAEFGAPLRPRIAGSLGGGVARLCPSGLATGTPQTFPVACRHAMNNAHRKFPPRHYQRDAPHPAQIRQVRAGGVCEGRNTAGSSSGGFLS